MPPERALVAEERVRHRLVDDDHARRSAAVALREVAAGEEGRAHRLEVVRRDARDRGLRLASWWRRLAAGDHEPPRLGQPVERHRVGEAGRGDTGKRLEPLLRAALEVVDLAIVVIGRGR